MPDDGKAVDEGSQHGSVIGSLSNAHGMSQAQENTLRLIKNEEKGNLIGDNKKELIDVDDCSHRKNQNLNLLIKDLFHKKEGIQHEIEDETLSVLHDGAPKKKKLNTLLGGIHLDDDDKDDEDSGNETEDVGKIDLKVNALKKFDIK